MPAEEDLAAAAATIRSMPKALISQRFAQLEAERQRRSDFSAASQETELDSVQLDEAAYRLASEYHARGKLREAARWYQTAALNDYADAALQLGYVLEGLAEKYIDSPGSPQVVREELALVEEASRWYAEALGAGYFEEAAERLDIMIPRHHPGRPRPAPADPPRPPELRADPCDQGGLRAVNERSTVETAALHVRHCEACQHELLAGSGILPALQR